jgi:scyllo-inositol 2-dehydrogenase (NADP+)
MNKHKFRIIIVGFGVQGKKRKIFTSDHLISIVDPIAVEADVKNIKDISLDDFDAALICTGDKDKLDIIEYLLKNNKHVLVEKPLLSNSTKNLTNLLKLSKQNKVTCYTAYNHRFEPHFVKMKQLIQSGKLGKIYHVRMFYGNGTANLVKNSVWRDQNSGVLTDLGSHLLDTLHFWINDITIHNFEITKAHKKENFSFDHIIINSVSEKRKMSIELEMSLISWKNTFTCDVIGEKGSAHINSLCKWGPSEFIYRSRILPSGTPIETQETLIQKDPTWNLEYNYFVDACGNNDTKTLEKDIWINQTLLNLSEKANVKYIV